MTKNDLFSGVNIQEMFDQVESEVTLEYRDALLPPYGVREKATKTQLKAWKFLKERTGVGPLIAMLAAKGGAKTHFGAAFAMHQSQVYVGSIGCVISNTYPQAKDNAGPILMKVCRNLGYEIEFFTKKKIRGRPMTNVFVVDLDGKGWNDGMSSYVLVRSFDAVEMLEGIELDWLWCEEIQSAAKSQFNVVWSRNRGQFGDNACFVAGMSAPEGHWQYSLLPALGFVEEDKYEGAIRTEIIKPTGEPVVAVTDGIMYEFSVFENEHNVGINYIHRNLASMSADEAARLVYGKRGSVKTNRVYYAYDSDVHQRGVMSQMLCEYDSRKALVFSVDFNVFPMTCTVWQRKPWSDDWDNFYTEDGHTFYRLRTPGKHHVTRSELEEIYPPDRIVLAQVDEYEVWSGGTRGLMEQIVDDYSEHGTRVILLGDATANRMQSSAEATDWQIIARAARNFVNPIVIRGLISNLDVRKGVTRYSNPPNRDAINNANRLLMDGLRRAHVCFLPKSKLESGGAANAIASLSYLPNGAIDLSNERKDDKSAPRSHFCDTVKYVLWWHDNGTHSTEYASEPEAKGEARADRDAKGEAREWLSERAGFAF